MDWFSYAQNDWSIYHDTTRIAKYVQYGKLTSDQYEQITGEPYVILLLFVKIPLVVISFLLFNQDI
jgi:hypothetical protein